MDGAPPIPANLRDIEAEILTGWSFYSDLQFRIAGHGTDNRPGQERTFNSVNYTKNIAESPSIVSPAKTDNFLANTPGFPNDGDNYVYHPYQIDRRPLPLDPAGGPWPKDPANKKYLDYHGLMRSHGDHQGVIVNTECFDRGDPLYLSEALFYAWKAFSIKQAQPLAELRWIVHTNIENELSAKVIAAVHNARGLGGKDDAKAKTWEYSKYPAEVCALIGVGLGRTTMRFLTQHYTELGGRRIKSVRSQPVWGGIAMLAFELE